MRTLLVTTSFLLFLGAATSCSTKSDMPNLAPTMTLDCNDGWLKEQVLDWSERSSERDLMIDRVLKIYDGVSEQERNEQVLHCKGEAKLSSGGVWVLNYYVEADRDGDLFLRYTFGRRVE